MNPGQPSVKAFLMFLGPMMLANILQALSGIYSAPDTPEWQERSRRLVRLLMDGLRAGASGRTE